MVAIQSAITPLPATRAARLFVRLLVRLCLIGAATLAVLLAPLSVQGQTMLTAEQIKQGYIEHATLAQLHRWFLPYENYAVPIKNSLDILTNGVSIKSSLGESVGHAA